MCEGNKTGYGHNVVANGRNWNSLKLLTGMPTGKGGHVLRAVDVRINDDGVLVVLKKDSPKGPMVAFLNAKNLDDALYVVAAGVKAKNLGWKPDKFRSMRSDKT